MGQIDVLAKIFASELTEIIDSEGLCLETELKLRMENLNFYEDYTSQSLERMSEKQEIRVKTFDLYENQWTPSRYYYHVGLSEMDRRRILERKRSLYQRVWEIHSNRAYSADYLEALMFLSLVKTALAHPQLKMAIFNPHDRIDWINGYRYAFDGFFTLNSRNYGVQVKNSLHTLFPTSTDLTEFLQLPPVCQPILISRLSSKGLKTALLKKKGRAFDLKTIIICTEDNPTYDREPFRNLGIDESIFESPFPLRVAGEEMTGTDFFSNKNYQRFSLEELGDAGDRCVPPVLDFKMNGLVRLLYVDGLIDSALKSVMRRGEALLGAFLASASYNYLLASKRRTVPIDTLYEYSKLRVKGKLTFYLQRIGDTEAKDILVQNLRKLKKCKLLGEPSRRNFQIKDALHPEEWLYYQSPHLPNYAD